MFNDDDEFPNGPEPDNFAKALRDDAMKFPSMPSLFIREEQKGHLVFYGYRYFIQDTSKMFSKMDNSKVLYMNRPIDQNDLPTMTELLSDLGLHDNWTNDLIGDMHLPPHANVPAPLLIRDAPPNFKDGTYYTRDNMDNVLSGPYVTLPNSKMICAHGKFVGFSNSETDDIRFGNEIGTYTEMEYEMGVLRRYDFYGANISDTLEPIYNKSEAFVFTAYFDEYGYLTEVDVGDLSEDSTDTTMTIDRDTGMVTVLDIGPEGEINRWLTYSIKDNQILEPPGRTTGISRYGFFGPQIGLIPDKEITYFYNDGMVTESIFYRSISNDALTFKKNQMDMKMEIDKYIAIPGIQDIIMGYVRVTPKWLDVLIKARNNLHNGSAAISDLNAKISEILGSL